MPARDFIAGLNGNPGSYQQEPDSPPPLQPRFARGTLEDLDPLNYYRSQHPDAINLTDPDTVDRIYGWRGNYTRMSNIPGEPSIPIPQYGPGENPNLIQLGTSMPSDKYGYIDIAPSTSDTFGTPLLDLSYYEANPNYLAAGQTVPQYIQRNLSGVDLNELAQSNQPLFNAVMNTLGQVWMMDPEKQGIAAYPEVMNLDQIALYAHGLVDQGNTPEIKGGMPNYGTMMENLRAQGISPGAGSAMGNAMSQQEQERILNEYGLKEQELVNQKVAYDSAVFSYQQACYSQVSTNSGHQLGSGVGTQFTNDVDSCVADYLAQSTEGPTVLAMGQQNAQLEGELGMLANQYYQIGGDPNHLGNHDPSLFAKIMGYIAWGYDKTIGDANSAIFKEQNAQLWLDWSQGKHIIFAEPGDPAGGDEDMMAYEYLGPSSLGDLLAECVTRYGKDHCVGSEQGLTIYTKIGQVDLSKPFDPNNPAHLELKKSMEEIVAHGYKGSAGRKAVAIWLGDMQIGTGLKRALVDTLEDVTFYTSFVTGAAGTFGKSSLLLARAENTTLASRVVWGAAALGGYSLVALDEGQMAFLGRWAGWGRSIVRGLESRTGSTIASRTASKVVALTEEEAALQTANEVTVKVKQISTAKAASRAYGQEMTTQTEFVAPKVQFSNAERPLLGKPRPVKGTTFDVNGPASWNDQMMVPATTANGQHIFLYDRSGAPLPVGQYALDDPLVYSASSNQNWMFKNEDGTWDAYVVTWHVNKDGKYTEHLIQNPEFEDQATQLVTSSLGLRTPKLFPDNDVASSIYVGRGIDNTNALGQQMHLTAIMLDGSVDLDTPIHELQSKGLRQLVVQMDTPYGNHTPVLITTHQQPGMSTHSWVSTSPSEDSWFNPDTLSNEPTTTKRNTSIIEVTSEQAATNNYGQIKFKAVPVTAEPLTSTDPLSGMITTTPGATTNMIIPWETAHPLLKRDARSKVYHLIKIDDDYVPILFGSEEMADQVLEAMEGGSSLREAVLEVAEHPDFLPDQLLEKKYHGTFAEALQKSMDNSTTRGFSPVMVDTAPVAQAVPTPAAAASAATPTPAAAATPTPGPTGPRRGGGAGRQARQQARRRARQANAARERQAATTIQQEETAAEDLVTTEDLIPAEETVVTPEPTQEPIEIGGQLVDPETGEILDQQPTISSPQDQPGLGPAEEIGEMDNMVPGPTIDHPVTGVGSTSFYDITDGKPMVVSVSSDGSRITMATPSGVVEFDNWQTLQNFHPKQVRYMAISMNPRNIGEAGLTAISRGEDDQFHEFYDAISTVLTDDGGPLSRPLIDAGQHIEIIGGRAGTGTGLERVVTHPVFSVTTAEDEVRHLIPIGVINDGNGLRLGYYDVTDLMVKEGFDAAEVGGKSFGAISRAVAAVHGHLEKIIGSGSARRSLGRAMKELRTGADLPEGVSFTPDIGFTNMGTRTDNLALLGMHMDWKNNLAHVVVFDGNTKSFRSMVIPWNGNRSKLVETLRTLSEQTEINKSGARSAIQATAYAGVNISHDSLMAVSTSFRRMMEGLSLGPMSEITDLDANAIISALQNSASNIRDMDMWMNTIKQFGSDVSYLRVWESIQQTLDPGFVPNGRLIKMEMTPAQTKFWSAAMNTPSWRALQYYREEMTNFLARTSRLYPDDQLVVEGLAKNASESAEDIFQEFQKLRSGVAGLDPDDAAELGREWAREFIDKLPEGQTFVTAEAAQDFVDISAESFRRLAGIFSPNKQTSQELSKRMSHFYNIFHLKEGADQLTRLAEKIDADLEMHGYHLLKMTDPGEIRTMETYITTETAIRDAINDYAATLLHTARLADVKMNNTANFANWMEAHISETIKSIMNNPDFSDGFKAVPELEQFIKQASIPRNEAGAPLIQSFSLAVLEGLQSGKRLDLHSTWQSVFMRSVGWPGIVSDPSQYGMLQRKLVNEFANTFDGELSKITAEGVNSSKYAYLEPDLLLRNSGSLIENSSFWSGISPDDALRPLRDNPYHRIGTEQMASQLSDREPLEVLLGGLNDNELALVTDDLDVLEDLLDLMSASELESSLMGNLPSIPGESWQAKRAAEGITSPMEKATRKRVHEAEKLYLRTSAVSQRVSRDTAHGIYALSNKEEMRQGTELILEYHYALQDPLLFEQFLKNELPVKGVHYLPGKTHANGFMEMPEVVRRSDFAVNTASLKGNATPEEIANANYSRAFFGNDKLTPRERTDLWNRYRDISKQQPIVGATVVLPGEDGSWRIVGSLPFESTAGARRGKTTSRYAVVLEQEQFITDVTGTENRQIVRRLVPWESLDPETRALAAHDVKLSRFRNEDRGSYAVDSWIERMADWPDSRKFVDVPAEIKFQGEGLASDQPMTSLEINVGPNHKPVGTVRPAPRNTSMQPGRIDVYNLGLLEGMRIDLSQLPIDPAHITKEQFGNEIKLYSSIDWPKILNPSKYGNGSVQDDILGFHIATIPIDSLPDTFSVTDIDKIITGAVMQAETGFTNQASVRSVDLLNTLIGQHGPPARMIPDEVADHLRLYPQGRGLYPPPTPEEQIRVRQIVAKAQELRCGR